MHVDNSQCFSTLLFKKYLTPSQMTHFRLFQTERVSRPQLKIVEGSLKWKKTLWEKEKLLVTSNFSFSHSVFNRLVLQARKNQRLFGKGLSFSLQIH